jgi:hypothetical protein
VRIKLVKKRNLVMGSIGRYLFLCVCLLPYTCLSSTYCAVLYCPGLRYRPQLQRPEADLRLSEHLFHTEKGGQVLDGHSSRVKIEVIIIGRFF